MYQLRLQFLPSSHLLSLYGFFTLHWPGFNGTRQQNCRPFLQPGYLRLMFYSEGAVLPLLHVHNVLPFEIRHIQMNNCIILFLRANDQIIKMQTETLFNLTRQIQNRWVCSVSSRRYPRRSHFAKWTQLSVACGSCSTCRNQNLSQVCARFSSVVYLLDPQICATHRAPVSCTDRANCASGSAGPSRRCHLYSQLRESTRPRLNCCCRSAWGPSRLTNDELWRPFPPMWQRVECRQRPYIA